ncbi:hypothetical protein [Streptomyces sp. NPDC054975]
MAADAVMGVDDLSAEERAILREQARSEFMHGETALVTSTVEAYGLLAAERIYGADLVQRAIRLANGIRSSLMTLGHP